ncbi:MAG: hypothetical protein U1F58_09130 [Burkholderiales bacterium]
MLSDSCFEFTNAMQEGKNRKVVYAEIGKFREEVEHYSDPSWKYATEVLDDLRAATNAAFAGALEDLAALLHRANTVLWRYDLVPDHPWFELEWSAFKDIVDERPFFALTSVPRGRRYRLSAQSGSEHAPSEDLVVASFNRDWAEELRARAALLVPAKGRRREVKKKAKRSAVTMQ